MKKLPIESRMPCMNLFISSIAGAMPLAIAEMRLSTSLPMFARMSGIAFTSAVRIAANRMTAASSRTGTSAAMTSDSESMSSVECSVSTGRSWSTSCGMASARLLMISVIFGMMSCAEFATISTRLVTAADMSPFGSPSVVRRLSYAALVAAIEPDIVLSDSAAAFPAMPCFCWMRSMAVTTSAKLSMVRSDAWPIDAAYSFASAMRRSISVLVPPYPSFRLSSIV